MHEGPVAALPVQQQPSRHIYPQAVGDLQGQVPFLSQSSSGKLRTMSEPAPVLCCAPDPADGHAQGWMELKTNIASPCNDSQRSGHCELSQSSDVAPGTGLDLEVSDVDSGAAEDLKNCGDISTQQQEASPVETSLPDPASSSPAPDKKNHKHLQPSVNDSEECSVDLLRIVKHKPSAIVFRDHKCGSDKQAIVANDSSDSGDSSSSNTEEAEGDDGDEEDDFPDALQYKEFLVSRRRRHLSRNRKCSRKRQDAQPNGTAVRPDSESKPKFTGSQEEQEIPRNNAAQVRITRREESDNNQSEVLFTVPEKAAQQLQTGLNDNIHNNSVLLKCQPVGITPGPRNWAAKWYSAILYYISHTREKLSSDGK